MSAEFFRRSLELQERGEPFAVVTLVKREGSVPQDVGSKMLVTTAGREFGTVGGGRIEKRAVDHAIDRLVQRQGAELVTWNLNTDLGMTCGGRVELFFETVNAAIWPVVIFGAGHVTQALARVLTSLPCRVTCIDPREDWIEKLPAAIHTICHPNPRDLVGELDEHAFVLCMTQGHRTDVPVLIEIAKRANPFPFLGVIGSKTKAAVIRRELRESGLADSGQGASGQGDSGLSFYCPVGMPLGTNHPGEIAISIAAQLIQARDALRAANGDR